MLQNREAAWPVKYPVLRPRTCHAALRTSSNITENAIEWRFSGACLCQRIAQSALRASATAKCAEEAVTLYQQTQRPVLHGYATAHAALHGHAVLLAAASYLDGGNVADQLGIWPVKSVLTPCISRHEDALLAAVIAAG